MPERARRAPDPSERLRAIRALPDDPRSCRALLAAVDDVSLDVARVALRRLAVLAGAEHVTALRERMLAVDIGLVADVAATLRRLGDRNGAAAAAAAALAGGDGTARHKAVLALRELRDPATRPPLLRALADRERPVRRLALDALAVLPGDTTTVAACRRLLDDAAPPVRCAAVRAVAALDVEAAATLRRLVRDPDAHVRIQLGEVVTALERDTVRELLADADPGVRAAALASLARRPCPELGAAVGATVADGDWHVRRAACDALSAAGGAAAETALVHALLDLHPSVRGRALVALERLAGHELDRVLERHLGGAAPALRRALVEILGRRGRGDIALRLASDASAEVRLAVVRALDPHASDGARAALRALCADEDTAVRHAAASALAGL